ncbi:hypothetical protein EV683_10518 [Crenobacter luteus]|uniref:hypothetical protein n=1 Tax=Crenobacter luteus TaxID=1452487 RepID=UPI0010E2EA1B|nr:hypothetical protein [Crenobacter luteus]TCP13773.1 hypothetical protein EV683_10518 [Crenobacter luteus]
MKTYFSATTLGFYVSAIHSDRPADAVEIAHEEYVALLEGQSAGQLIAADEQGRPTLASPPPPPLAERRAAALARLNAACEAALAALKADCPESEVSSWAKQEAEARALQADPATPTPLLSAIAAARGLTAAELAARVLAKSDAYAVAAGALIGRRQALEDALAAIDLGAPDAEARIDAIRWDDQAAQDGR